jgi:DNA-binding PadR family transcriptional regulator
MFRYILLGLLRAGAAQHGYGLIKAYRSRSGLDVNSGTVYRELRRLQADDLIRVAKSPTGRRPRAPYEITEAGRVAFEAWLRRVAFQARRKYDSVLVHKAMFLSSAGDPMVARLLAEWQEELWFEGKVLERAHGAAVEEAKARPDSFSPLPLLIARRLRYLTAETEFLDAVKAVYNGWKAKSRAARRKRRGRNARGQGQASGRESLQKIRLNPAAATPSPKGKPRSRRRNPAAISRARRKRPREGDKS